MLPHLTRWEIYSFITRPWISISSYAYQTNVASIVNSSMLLVFHFLLFINLFLLYIFSWKLLNLLEDFALLFYLFTAGSIAFFSRVPMKSANLFFPVFTGWVLVGALDKVQTFSRQKFSSDEYLLVEFTVFDETILPWP